MACYTRAMTRAKRHPFNEAATRYDAHATYQHRQTARLVDAARMLVPAGARVLDIGCGTGQFARQAGAGSWRVTGLDLAPAMCGIARAYGPVVCADASALPFAAGRFDAAVSSLCLQWVEDLPRAMGELRRALRPGGLVLTNALIAGTLNELAHAAESAQLALPLLTMRTHSAYASALAAQGFALLLCDTVHETLYYPSVTALLDSMRRIGAQMPHARPGTLRASRYRALCTEYERRRNPQGLPASWVSHLIVARAA